MSHDLFIRKGFTANLPHMMEEAGEVIAAAGKLQRFGPLSANPLIPHDEREPNIVWLLRELNDLEQAMARVRHEAHVEFGRQIASGIYTYPEWGAGPLEDTTR